MAALSSVTDDFNDGVFDARWTTHSVGVAEASGVITITPSTGYPKLRTATIYSFVEDAVYVQCTLTGATSTTLQTFFEVYKDDNNIYRMEAHTDILYFSAFIGAVENRTSVAYNATSHAWFMIQETGGNILWWTSPTALTGSWTLQRTLARTIDTSAGMAVDVVSGFGTTTPGTPQFDNLNIPQDAPVSPDVSSNIGVTAGYFTPHLNSLGWF